MNLDDLKTNNKILGIILYGSMARKDYDLFSDKDVLILLENIDINEGLAFKNSLINNPARKNENFSLYCYDDFLRMAQKGSLFMWHLKLQGNIIYSKNNIVEKIFIELQPYRNYAQDLKYYSELLGDVKNSSRIYKTRNEVDLALLFTIARNTCMLICFKYGTPRFGRSDAYLKVKSVFEDKLPISEGTYSDLRSWKLWNERAIIPENLIEKFPMDQIIDCVYKLIEFGKEYCL